MLARVELVGGTGRTELMWEEMGGVPCLCARMGRRGKGELRRAAKAFRAAAVRRVILPEGMEGGVPEPWLRGDPDTFYRDVADLIALGWLAERRIPLCGAVVRLTGPRLAPEVKGAAVRLCRWVRGVSVDIPGEGDGFARWLHREYGVAVVRGGDVTLSFGGDGEGIDLTGRRPLPVELSAPALSLPGGYRDRLLAALWQCGGVRREQIRVNDRGVGDFLLTNPCKVHIMP